MMTQLKHILVIEDTDVDFEVLSNVIIGYDNSITITWLSDYQEAKDHILQLVRPDCSPLPIIIFLDLHLHGNPTFDLLTCLTTEKRTQRIPVITYSSSDRSDNMTECCRRGASGYLLKSIDLADISRRATALLKKYSQ